MNDRSARGARAHRTGLAAEESAARLLEEQGMTVLERRLRTPHGEIDLIALDAATLVFVEVKARSKRADAAQAITRRQWARLEAAALHFAAETGRSGSEMRFDVVLTDAAGRCERIENARSFDEW